VSHMHRDYVIMTQSLVSTGTWLLALSGVTVGECRLYLRKATGGLHRLLTRLCLKSFGGETGGVWVVGIRLLLEY